ncbi:hypothetical protein ACFQ3Z_05265 [Streptomyces nogalater]
MTVAALRRTGDEERDLVTAVARLHAAGTDVDWAAFFAPYHARPTPCPPTPSSGAASGWTPPRRRWRRGRPRAERHRPPAADRGDRPARQRGAVLTGRLSRASHPWLADHTVHGTVLLPGTAFVELALQAAERTGCATVGELTLHAPLILPEQGALAVQAAVGPDRDGQRELTIWSRRADTPDAPGPATPPASSPTPAPPPTPRTRPG